MRIEIDITEDIQGIWRGFSKGVTRPFIVEAETLQECLNQVEEIIDEQSETDSVYAKHFRFEIQTGAFAKANQSEQQSCVE